MLLCDQDAGAPAINMLETKILLNSVISDAQKGARFMSADIKNYFLATPIQKPEFMILKHNHLQNDIRTHYNLDSKVTHNDCVCMKLKKGMPDLKQVAKLAHDHLCASFEPCGCGSIPHTVGLWRRETRPKNSVSAWMILV